MTAPLPISLEVRAPYETAVKYAKGSAIALTAVALTTLVPPVAGVLGLALATKTVFILTSAAFVSVLTSGGLGLIAAISYRTGYQALFDEALKGSGGHPLIPSKSQESDLNEAFENKLALKQAELDRLNDELKAVKNKLEEALSKLNESDRSYRDEILNLQEELEKKKKSAAELKELTEARQKELEEKEIRLLSLKEALSKGLAEKETIEKKLESLKDKEDRLDALAQKNSDLERQLHELKKKEDKQKSPSSEKARIVNRAAEIKQDEKREIERLNKEIAALKGEIAQHHAEASLIQKLGAEINQLEKEKLEQALILKKIESECSCLKDKLLQYEEKIKTQEKEIDKLNPLQLAQRHAKELKGKEAVIADLKEEIDALKKAHERAINAKVQESAIEIDTLNRRLKRLEEELRNDKRKLNGDIERLEKELEAEKRGARSSQDNHAQEKLSIETNLKKEIEEKQKEVEALKSSILEIKNENERIAKEKEQALLLKISNAKSEMAELQEELSKYHLEFNQMSINALQHEAVIEELSLSKKRINDFLEEQKRLREINQQLKQEKEDNIEILELRLRVSELERYNEGYQEEIKGKVSRIQALENQVSTLEKALADLKGQPIETIALRREPSRWSIRKKELEFESKMPKEIVNKGEDSKVNSYHVVPKHRLDVASVMNKFKSQEECDHFELMTLFKEIQNNYKAECKKDIEKKAIDQRWDFNYSKENFRKLLLDLSGDKELQSSTLLHKNVQSFIKIGIYYLESDTLAGLFSYLKSLTTLESLNAFLEGYILRLQKGHGIAHDTTLEAVISHYVTLVERSNSKNLDHLLFYEAVFILIFKNSDIVLKNLSQLDRLGLMTDEQAQSFLNRCLSHFQHPDTNALCMYLKERIEKNRPLAE